MFRTRTGKVFAVDGTCPHKGGPLADGMLVGEQVVCPLHAFRFDGDDRRVRPAGRVRDRDVSRSRCDDGAVFVTVPRA